MNHVPMRWVIHISWHSAEMCGDMTGTCLHCGDVIVLMAFQRAVTSPLSSVTSSLFLIFSLTPTCYPSIAPSASPLRFQFHFDSSPRLPRLHVSFFFRSTGTIWSFNRFILSAWPCDVFPAGLVWGYGGALGGGLLSPQSARKKSL